MKRSLWARSLHVCAVLALVGVAVATSSHISASPPLQEVPRLDGARIYFTEANREASPFDRSPDGMSRFAGLLQSVGAEISVLDWRRDIPADADLIVIGGPTRDLDDSQSARLWVYLKGGGSLLVFSDPLAPATTLEGDSIWETNRALRADRGLFALTWADYGIAAHEDVVVSQDDSELIADFAAVDFAPNHAITDGLEGPLAFSRARSLRFDASLQNFVALPLVFSDDTFYGETAFPDYLLGSTSTFDPTLDLSGGPLALAVAAEDRVTGSRIIIVGDREFATNGVGLATSPPYTPAFLNPGNLQFLLRSVAWLIDADLTETVSLSFPTAGPTTTAMPTLAATQSPPATPTPVESPTPAPNVLPTQTPTG